MQSQAGAAAKKQKAENAAEAEEDESGDDEESGEEDSDDEDESSSEVRAFPCRLHAALHAALDTVHMSGAGKHACVVASDGLPPSTYHNYGCLLHGFLAWEVVLRPSCCPVPLHLL